MDGVVQAFPVIDTMGRQVMQTPEDVAQMLRLRAAGLGIKYIARKMGCSKNTVRPLPARWRLGGVQATSAQEHAARVGAVAGRAAATTSR